MSWWAEEERNFFYICENGHEFEVKLKTKDGRDMIPCLADPLCDVAAHRQGFSSIKLGSPLVVTSFEQNGRKARRYRNGNDSTYISESKLHYLETGDTGGKYTKAYDERIVKDTVTRERARKAIVAKIRSDKDLVNKDL